MSEPGTSLLARTACVNPQMTDPPTCEADLRTREGATWRDQPVSQTTIGLGPVSEPYTNNLQAYASNESFVWEEFQGGLFVRQC
jgi:hypothetical protein